MASDIPDLIEIATTRVEGTSITFEWEAPDDNNAPLLEYDIIFLASDGQYVSHSDCDG
jgi:hypothetical protein